MTAIITFGGANDGLKAVNPLLFELSMDLYLRVENFSCACSDFMIFDALASDMGFELDN